MCPCPREEGLIVGRVRRPLDICVMSFCCVRLRSAFGACLVVVPASRVGRSIVSERNTRLRTYTGAHRET